MMIIINANTSRQTIASLANPLPVEIRLWGKGLSVRVRPEKYFLGEVLLALQPNFLSDLCWVPRHIERDGLVLTETIFS